MAMLEKLLEALKANDIAVVSIDGRHVKTEHAYDIEIEDNGMYKLREDGYIVGPFDDVDRLCRCMKNPSL